MNTTTRQVLIGIAVVLVVGLGAWFIFGNSKMANSPSPSTSVETATSTSPQAKQTIVDVAAGNPDFSTLVTAIKTAGLTETLSAAGPYTVFAPTNEAFAKLPAGTLDNLLKNPEQLKAVLTYHVVPGNVSSAEVVKLTSVKTVNGKELPITVAGQTVKVGPATVTKTDVQASNGTIHVIDTVLVP